MDPITTGIALAKFVPEIIGWFGGSEKKAAAEKLVEIAESVTGKKSHEALAALEADAAVALEYQKAVMADKYKLDEMFLADRQGAREMVVQSGKMGELASRTANAIMVWNLPAVGVLILAQCITLIMLKEMVEIVALVSNAIGFVINALLNERQQVTGFLFGSSMGSKLKTLMGKK